jgi:methenyltetrahydromethanopterin cyclohydrolase
MARTNDAILYGGTAYYFISYSDEEKLKVFIEKSPSEASDDYGKPFIEIFKEAGYDFYKIDANLFAPAMITITNVETGNTFRSGRINLEALIKSFGMKPQQ